MRKKLFIIFCIIVVFISVIPNNAYGITLGEYEAKVNKYQKELDDTKKAINKTESEIAAANNEISKAKKEMQDLESEIEDLHKEIEDGKAEIKEKSLQVKEFFAYLQVTNGENAYLEYAFGADNITDFIYRMSIVEQMTEYNNQVIEDLEEMIERNNKRETEIHKKEEELTQKQKSLESKIVTLGEDKAALEDSGVDSAKQLKIYQEIVASYKKLGCKSSDVIGVDCAVSGPAGTFRRPTTTGYITSEFGWRWGSLHRGVDITSSNGKNEKIYPVANGTIIAKYHDTYGALVIIVEHYNDKDNKWYSSLYAHMSSFAPNMYVGKYVTSDQYIGYMGNTGYVIPKPTASNPNAGTHLHLEIAPCKIFKDTKCSKWSKYTSYMSQLSKNGFKGPRALISFPSSGTRWSTR